MRYLCKRFVGGSPLLYSSIGFSACQWSAKARIPKLPIPLLTSSCCCMAPKMSYIFTSYGTF